MLVILLTKENNIRLVRGTYTHASCFRLLLGGIPVGISTWNQYLEVGAQTPSSQSLLRDHERPLGPSSLLLVWCWPLEALCMFSVLECFWRLSVGYHLTRVPHPQLWSRSFSVVDTVLRAIRCWKAFFPLSVCSTSSLTGITRIVYTYNQLYPGRQNGLYLSPKLFHFQWWLKKSPSYFVILCLKSIDGLTCFENSSSTKKPNLCVGK